jgi:hypothetical protein
MRKENFLQILIENGRKEVRARPGLADNEMLEVDERVELAGHLLAEEIDSIPDSELLRMLFTYTSCRLLPALAEYLIDDHTYNEQDLLQELRDMVRHAYEDNGKLQAALTDYRIKLWMRDKQAIDQIKQKDQEDAQREVAL